MATHTMTLGVRGSGITRSQKITASQAGVSLIDGEAVATAETDYELDFNLDVSLCKTFYLVSDQDVLFEVNDGAGTGGSISLLANVPYFWHTNSYDSFLLGTDVTSVFITNASGSTVTIHCVALFDAVIP